MLEEFLQYISAQRRYSSRTCAIYREAIEAFYHYVYPDGVSTPKVTFRSNAKDKNGGSVERNYTFTFNAALQKATWYKIRTFIEGFTNQKTDITITPEGPGGEAVTTE